MKRGEKKASCSRGHSTISPEARDSRGRCRTCHRLTAMKYYRNSSGVLSDEKYQDMFAAQDGLCAICMNPERRLDKNGRVKQLCADHDHKTGQCRQLLCGDCNIALGLMQDDVLRLNAAIVYLTKHRGR